MKNNELSGRPSTKDKCDSKIMSVCCRAPHHSQKCKPMKAGAWSVLFTADPFGMRTLRAICICSSVTLCPDSFWSLGSKDDSGLCGLLQ